MENAWRSWRLGETASVDSNILIYAGAQDAGDKTQTARKLLRELGLRHGVVAVQALGGFFVNAVRSRINLDDALQAIVLWQSAFTTIAAQPAALAENGVRVLFSEDLQDGQTIDGVLIINPFGQDT